MDSRDRPGDRRLQAQTQGAQIPLSGRHRETVWRKVTHTYTPTCADTHTHTHTNKHTRTFKDLGSHYLVSQGERITGNTLTHTHTHTETHTDTHTRANIDETTQALPRHPSDQPPSKQEVTGGLKTKQEEGERAQWFSQSVGCVAMATEARGARDSARTQEATPFCTTDCSQP